MLLSSRDIFLSTQQSGSVGTAESSFDKFRMCMNTSPITCDNGQMIKLALTQFYANRSFYLINKFNNRFDVWFTYQFADDTTSTTPYYRARPMYLEEGDYETIEDIQTEFRQKLCDVLKLQGLGIDADMKFEPEQTSAGTDGSTNDVNITTKTPAHKMLDITIQRVVGGNDNTEQSQTEEEQKADKAIDATLVDIKIVCPQFHSESDPTSFNESYIILGGKRCTTHLYPETSVMVGSNTIHLSDNIVAAEQHIADGNYPNLERFSAIESSFDITIDNTATDTLDGNTYSAQKVRVRGYFPMELKTNCFVYLKCHESGSNMQSQNLDINNIKNSNPDTHMLSSSILAKIPVDQDKIAIQFDNDSPSFLYTSNQHVSEVLFELVDHHGRPLPKPLLVISKTTDSICDYNGTAIDSSGAGVPNQYRMLDYVNNKAYFNHSYLLGNVDIESGTIVSEGNADYDMQRHGSMFNDMSLKVEIYATGGNEHTLKAPHQDWNYLKNTTSQVQSFFPH